MHHLLYLLPALGCPIAMGAMMWFMMLSGKSGRSGQQAPFAPPAAQLSAQDQEIAALRAEVDQLHAAQRDSEAAGPQRPA